MAVAIDTYDAENGIHPTNKQVSCTTKSKFALIAHLNFCQIVGERLAIAGLNIAYGMTDLPTNGPFFTNIDIETMPDGNFSITIDYDQSFEYDSSETNGFYVCCDYDMLECDEHCGRWQLVRY